MSFLGVRASHMMGGDIIYECLSPGKFKFTIKVYRDCRGIAFNNPTITVFCADGGGVNNSVSVNYARTAINDITPKCATGTAPCNPQNQQAGEGIEEHIFEAIVDFNTAPFKAIKDAGCCEIKIKVEQCCRNGAITTVTPDNFYTDAMINICNIAATKNKCNTSPQLSTPPVAYICCNQPFTFNNGVRETVDGDSLSYDLVTPLKANNTNLLYTGNFTSNIPMTPFCPPNKGVINCRPLPNAKPPRGFYFDKETGDIVFTPTQCDEVGIIVIQVTEWRKDSARNKWVKIGYTRRDMQLIVKTCPDNNPPYFGTLNKYSVCEGNKLCFFIDAKDDPFLPKQTVPDTVTLTWNFGIPGATFTIVDPKAREKQALFCWQTKIGDARPNVYSFTATAKDDNCSNPSSANKGYTVTVKPKARTKRQLEVLDCGKFKFTSWPVDTVNYNQKNYQYKWTIRDSLNTGTPLYFGFKKQDSIKFKRGGKYIIEHEITNPPYNCPSIYSDTVIIPPQLDVNLAFGKDTFVCEKDSLIIKPLISNGVPTYKYNWIVTPALPSPLIINDSIISLKRNFSSTVIVQLTDKNKCVDQDTIKIKYVNLPIVNIGPDQRICTYKSVVLDAQHKDTVKYCWNTTDSSRTIQVNIAGKYWVKVIDPVYGCFAKDTMELFVNDTVVAIAKPNREICIFDTLKVKANRKPLGYTRLIIWKDISSGNIMSNDSSFKLKINNLNTLNYEMYLQVNQGGVVCEDRDTLTVTINNLPSFKFNNIPPRCYIDGAINLTMSNVALAKSGDGTQQTTNIRYFQNKKPSWVTGGPVGVNTFTYDYPKFITNSQVPKTGLVDTICYDYRDYKGCYNKECKTIKLYPNPSVDIVDKTHCQSAGLLTLDNLIKLPSVKIGGIQTFTCISGPTALDSLALISTISPAATFPVTYTFDPGTELEPERTGEYRIQYCYQDAITGCKSCDTATIKVIKLPVIQFEPFPRICINDNPIVLDSFAFDKNNNTRFVGNWKTLEYGRSRVLPNPKITNSIPDQKHFYPSYGPGIFLIKLSDNSSGCLVEDSIEIAVNGLPIIQLDNPDIVCSSSSPFTLNNQVPSGNVGKWSGFGVIGRDFDPSISPKTKQFEFWFKVRFDYTNPLTGCSNFQYDSFVIQTQPEVNITTPKPYQQCEGIPFNISATKKWATNTQWTKNGDGSFRINTPLDVVYTHGTQDTINNNVVIGIETVKEGVCPIAKDSIPLIIEAYPQFNFTGNPLIQCEPGIVDFNSIVRKPLSNLEYYWDLGNGDTSIIANPFNIQYDTANRQWYDVKLTVTNNWGNGKCITTLSKLDYVKILPQPKADYYTDPNYFTTIAFPKFKFVNQTKIRWGEDSLKYLWNFDLKNPDDTSTKKSLVKIYPDDTAVYTTFLISSFTYQGVTCRDSISKTVKIGPDVTVFVPTVFSPEKTGPILNNKFYAVVNGEKSFHIEVLNRWGEMVWKTDNKYEGWDGTYRNEDCQQDVYVWVIRVTAYDGEEYQYEGTITLLR
jgi:gliding motility-associated-like protein